MKKYTFVQAMPVWAADREYEKNLWLEFSTELQKSEGVTLSLACSCVYSLRINGKFIAFGPARSAHGFYRVDEIDLTELLSNGRNKLTITVAGYNVNSFYTLDQPSFLCAEIAENGKIVAATGKSGFRCRQVTEHEQKVGRYTYQRAFSEIYDLKKISDDEIKVVFVNEEKTFIYRDSALNVYPREKAEGIVFRGKVHIGDHKAELKYPRQLVTIDNEKYKGYKLEELTTDLHLLARNIDIDSVEKTDSRPKSYYIENGSYAVIKMKHDTTGTVSLKIKSDEPNEILLTFSEIISPDNTVDYRFGGMTRAILWRIPAGEYTLENFEPYSMQYIAVYPLKGAVTINDFEMVCFGADKPDVKLKSSDTELNAIFDAAIETYRQNTFTIYMDCPSRERA